MINNHPGNASTVFNVPIRRQIIAKDSWTASSTSLDVHCLKAIFFSVGCQSISSCSVASELPCLAASISSFLSIIDVLSHTMIQYVWCFFEQ